MYLKKEFIDPSISIFFVNFLAPPLIGPTVAHMTNCWFKQFVDKVGSTIFN